MKRPRALRTWASVGLIAGVGSVAAHAQMAVYDGANYAQLTTEVAQGVRQLEALNQQTSLQTLMVSPLSASPSPTFAEATRQIMTALAGSTGASFWNADAPAYVQATYAAPAAAPPGVQGAPADLAAWQSTTRQALTTALAAENSVVQAQPGAASGSAAALAASQGAVGPTAVAQASNQLLAGLSSELIQLQGVVIAGQRAAETTAIEQQSVAIAARQESLRVLTYSPPDSRLALNGQI